MSRKSYVFNQAELYDYDVTAGDRNDCIVGHWKVQATNEHEAIQRLAETDGSFRLAWAENGFEIVVSRVVCKRYEV